MNASTDSPRLIQRTHTVLYSPAVGGVIATGRDAGLNVVWESAPMPTFSDAMGEADRLSRLPENCVEDCE